MRLFTFELINIPALLDIDKTPLNLISLLLNDHEFIISPGSCPVSTDVSRLFFRVESLQWMMLPSRGDCQPPPDGSLITDTHNCPRLGGSVNIKKGSLTRVTLLIKGKN